MEYRFVYGLYNNDETEIPVATLERIQDAFIEAVEAEGLWTGGGYGEYTWVDAVGDWITIRLLSWRNRVLRFRGKSPWRKGLVVFISKDGEGWTKLGPLKED